MGKLCATTVIALMLISVSIGGVAATHKLPMADERGNCVKISPEAHHLIPEFSLNLSRLNDLGLSLEKQNLFL